MASLLPHPGTLEEFSRHMMKVSVARILDNITIHAVNSDALEVMNSLTVKYFESLCKRIALNMESAGRRDVELLDLEAAFKEQNVDLTELRCFIDQVGNFPSVDVVPSYPVSSFPEDKVLEDSGNGSNDQIDVEDGNGAKKVILYCSTVPARNFPSYAEKTAYDLGYLQRPENKKKRKRSRTRSDSHERSKSSKKNKSVPKEKSQPSIKEKQPEPPKEPKEKPVEVLKEKPINPPKEIKEKLVISFKEKLNNSSKEPTETPKKKLDQLKEKAAETPVLRERPKTVNNISYTEIMAMAELNVPRTTESRKSGREPKSLSKSSKKKKEKKKKAKKENEKSFDTSLIIPVITESELSEPMTPPKSPEESKQKKKKPEKHKKQKKEKKKDKVIKKKHKEKHKKKHKKHIGSLYDPNVSFSSVLDGLKLKITINRPKPTPSAAAIISSEDVKL